MDSGRKDAGSDDDSAEEGNLSALDTGILLHLETSNPGYFRIQVICYNGIQLIFYHGIQVVLLPFNTGNLLPWYTAGNMLPLDTGNLLQWDTSIFYYWIQV